MLGNHEDELYFLDGDQALVEKFTAAGVTILRNQEARYTVRDNVISILGVEGSPEDFYNYGASTFMDSVEPQTDYDLRICLAHVPTYFPEHLENYSFELGLAGHTHGGIVRLPKIGPLYTAEEGFLPDYAGGSYELANNATLIVSRDWAIPAGCPASTMCRSFRSLTSTKQPAQSAQAAAKGRMPWMTSKKRSNRRCAISGQINTVCFSAC